jgi:transcriptional regulator with PAS, ATPase and Fis domain
MAKGTHTLRTVAALLVEALTGSESLSERAARIASAAGDGDQALRRIALAFLAALRGSIAESDVELNRARNLAGDDLKGSIELATALVRIEAGEPARAKGALERAEAYAEEVGAPAVDRWLARLLRAQALLLDDAVPAARAEVEGLLRLLEGAEGGSGLLLCALAVATEAALAASDLAGAAALLAQAEASATWSGITGARLVGARTRCALKRGQVGPQERAALAAVIEELSQLGAQRELGGAYVLMGEIAARDGADSPASWLVRAQPIIARSGTERDLRQLRTAFRSFGRRVIDRVDADVATATDAVREWRARLSDAVAAEREERDSPHEHVTPVGGVLVNDALDALGQAEERLVGALEHALADRERIGHLVAVSQEIASLDTVDELVSAIPRLALVFCPADTAVLIEVDAPDQVLERARVGPRLQQPLVRVAREATVACRDGLPRVISDDDLEAHRPAEFGSRNAPLGRMAVVPLRQSNSRAVLVLERRAPGMITERDLEQLAVYASLAGASMARARSGAALREAAARDAATLAAIRDGVVTLDQDGVVRAVNKSAERLLSVSRKAAIGHRLREIAGLSALADALASGRTLGGDVVMLGQRDVVARSQTYEGGTVVNLEELAAAQRLAHKLVGSSARFTFEDVIGRDPVLLACLRDARRAARSDVPILITGESGTGKEVLAQAIHNASPNAAAPFVGMNVAAIPRELIESELFGYERGAFTGARTGGNAGKFELAENGTLLLDELGDMPLDMQAKLLRVLQERVVQRLGGTRDIAIRARVIATTHRDLERDVEQRLFRLDLFHRLRVVHLLLPPLRARRSDIRLLAEHHLDRYAERLGRPPIVIADSLMPVLEAYEWPGNVRELVNVIEAEASLLGPEEKRIEKLPDWILHPQLRSPRAHGPERERSLPSVRSLREQEREICEHALLHFKGNVTQAARALGVAKNTVYNILRRSPPQVPEPDPASVKK